jgi:hypothetical protein
LKAYKIFKDGNMRSKSKRITKKEQDEIDYKEIRDNKLGLHKQAFYVFLVIAIIFFSMGIYLFAVNGSFFGTSSTGRFGASSRQGFISAPFVFIIAFIVLGLAFYFRNISRENKK